MKRFFLKYVVAAVLKLRRTVPVNSLEEGGRSMVDLAVNEEHKGIIMIT
jgi:hypothetical protein